MVLTARRTAMADTLIVPDEQTWTMSGSDPAADGFRPVFALGRARRLLVPNRLPAPLEDALQACRDELASDVEVERWVLPGLEGGQADGSMHGGAAENAAHTGHLTSHGGHRDMMAIVGEPSADGLVMESMELRLGPLGTPLPGGLAVEVTLDGDVVAEATVQALLSADSPAGGTRRPPDLLAPLTWTLAIEAATEGEMSTPWRRLAALEAERAVSHLAWLRAFGRILGWPVMVERCTRALEGLPSLAHGLPTAVKPSPESDRVAITTLDGAAARAAGLADLLARSRHFRLRTRGVGRLGAEQARSAGLRGPAARASGVRDDARTGVALYGRLAFEPVLHRGGDAYSRTLVRIEEAGSSLLLASAALRAEADGPATGARFPAPGDALEGPRGPVRAEQRSAGKQLSAPGELEALRAASQAMVGAEWSAALVGLASFDLSPWRVGP